MSATKQQAYYLAPDIIENGQVLGRLRKDDARKPDAYVIAAPVAIGDRTYYGLVEVRRDANGGRLYLHEAVARPMERSPGSVQSGAGVNQINGKPVGAPTGEVLSLLTDTLVVNSADVSQIVDANGEPLNE